MSHSESSSPAAGPLAGARIVSIAQNVPGPLAVARLAAAGARAIKVEPLSGDPFAPMCPSWYDEMHAGVDVRRLDLKSADGRAALGVLLRDADLLIASHRPSALTRLGLDPASLRVEAPGVRLLRIVGSIADPDTPGHDLTYQAQAGLLRGALPVTLCADVMASERAFAAALLLLREAPGTVVTVGIEDSLEPLRAPLRHGLTAPTGILGGGLPYYGVYPAKTGSVAVAALEPHFERRLRELLELSPAASPAARFLERTAADWEAWGKEHDLPIVAVV
jgi:crotonobetainyl-CoA:carnitine CoA-transferase CaiB-like acyl-CoA transferase